MSENKVKLPSYQSQLIKALFPEKRPHQNVEVRHEMFEVLTQCKHGEEQLQDAVQTIERWGLSGYDTGMNAALDTLEDLSAAAFVGHVYCGGSFTSQFAMPVKKCIRSDRQDRAIEALVSGAYRGFIQCMEHIATKDESTKKEIQTQLALVPCCVGLLCGTTMNWPGEISNQISEIFSRDKAAGMTNSTTPVVIEEIWNFRSSLTKGSLAEVVARNWAVRAFSGIGTTNCLAIMGRYFNPQQC